jgi:hypothetical protein
MTLLHLRRLALRPGALGRTLLLLALVGGVLIGLLAMHTISSASSGHMGSASAMSAGPNDHDGMSTTPAEAETLADWNGMWPSHSMAGMACVLALLISVLALAHSASRWWSKFLAALRAQRLVIAAVAVAALPPPPDLTALSISRT